MLNKEFVFRMLDDNDRAVIRALEVIYSNQTRTEQATNATLTANNIGFNKADAGRLTSIYDFYKSRGFLTPKQIALVRIRIKKYWRQLLASAEQKGHEVNYKAK